jgi:hypothetical protein
MKTLNPCKFSATPERTLKILNWHVISLPENEENRSFQGIQSGYFGTVFDRFFDHKIWPNSSSPWNRGVAREFARVCQSLPKWSTGHMLDASRA